MVVFFIDTDPYDYDRWKRKDYPDLVVRTKTLTKEEFKREYPVEFDKAFPSNVKPKKSWLYRATQNVAKALLMLMTKEK